MMRAEEVEAGAAGHGGGDGDDALVLGGHIRERGGEGLRVRLLGSLGDAGLGIVGAEAVEFLLAVECGLEAAALLGEYVEQDRAVLRLEELEGFYQQGQVVAVDGAEVLQA